MPLKPLLLFLALLVLAPAAWCAKYTVMHSFSGGNDGEMLWGSLLLDTQGNVYRTTYYGGANGGGTVFELSPQGDGKWSESVSYSFGKQGPAVPYAGVIMDATGNLYGTGGGYAYELSQGSSGWAVTNMQALPAPLGGVIRDPTGSLYGTTFYGGGSKNCGGGCGTVYRLHPKPDGSWQEAILHDFTAGRDGAFPGYGALAMDKSGSLYGTTEVGGHTGSGVVFRLKRNAGSWQETILYSIPGGNKGSGPLGAW